MTESKVPTSNADLKAAWKKEKEKAEAAIAENTKLRGQATAISQSYLDMRETAQDIAAIIAAQGRLFAKLPGIFNPKK